jgi:hypothetical protein
LGRIGHRRENRRRGWRGQGAFGKLETRNQNDRMKRIVKNLVIGAFGFGWSFGHLVLDLTWCDQKSINALDIAKLLG